MGKVTHITYCSPDFPAENKTPHITSGISEQENYNKWVKQYLSVSLPLDRIEVSSRFGTRKDPFTGKKSRHSGLDLRARYDKVYNMMYGVVIKVASDRRAGKHVSVRYGDYIVSFCHLSRQFAKKGMNVRPGEVIGDSGNTGRSTGPHLHLTVRYGGKLIDPYVFLQFIQKTKEEAVSGLASLKVSSI